MPAAVEMTMGMTMGMTVEKMPVLYRAMAMEMKE